MSSDIMADSQTEAVLAVLDRGEADATTQQRVSAALLRSQTKLLSAIEEMRKNMWSMADLKSLIKDEHDKACAACPARKLADADVPKTPWYAFVSNSGFQFFVITVLLVLAFVYFNVGKAGFDAVTGALPGVTGVEK